MKLKNLNINDKYLYVTLILFEMPKGQIFLGRFFQV